MHPLLASHVPVVAAGSDEKLVTENSRSGLPGAGPMVPVKSLMPAVSVSGLKA